MELKNYQQQNISALNSFLCCVDEAKNISEGFYNFWVKNNPPIVPFVGNPVEPYNDNVKGAPHVCLKVPTGGGKTFIASAALKVAMAHIQPEYKLVVWLVPSNAILEQTLRNLKNRQHPYRMRIDSDFNSRVEVFDKQQALTGHGFSLTTVSENLCILVMSFDSFRAQNKDGRKVYQENGYLQSFSPLVGKLDGDDEVQLMRVLQAVHPLVIVDESHNATSKLSMEMLNDLQPSLVVDFTATPKEKSNIICFTDAYELKKNHMVKLPVIVYNHKKKSEVIDSAIHLRNQLEVEAKRESHGRYIRPIVLFQAESKLADKEDRSTFDAVKSDLINLGIPENQIKIKTAQIDELKDMDLMSPDCPVRYIITINALKEGWDCPFAYILASLADRTSSVDVEQIVGRVLRLPYAANNERDVLNLSYVLTASAKFQETLQSVVAGLNNAGFSDKDYRAFTETEDDVDDFSFENEKTEEKPNTLTFSSDDDKTDSNENKVTYIEQQKYAACSTGQTDSAPVDEQKENENITPAVSNIIHSAIEQNQKMEKEMEKKDEVPVTPILAPAAKKGTIKSIFADSAKAEMLPKFFIANNSNQNALFQVDEDIELRNVHLLKDFKLSKQDADISFAAAEIEMVAVDIDSKSDEHTPVYHKIRRDAYESLVERMRDAKDVETLKRRCISMVSSYLRNFDYLSQRDVNDYISRIFENFTYEQVDDCMHNLNSYSMVIREKIVKLSEKYKKDEFIKKLDVDAIFLKDTFEIPGTITLKETIQGLPKMLHTKEESINGFELEVITDVANLDNVEWWTRNIERNGFCINGFINHYPDFIIKTKKGKIVLLETKGDHLDAEDKIMLGQAWATKAGIKYRYCLVYDKRQVDGAYTKDKFIDLLKNL